VPLTDDSLLTTADALAYLRTTPRTLYRHLAAGNIPAVRVGHQWRFRKTDLDQWLTRQGGRTPAIEKIAPAPAGPPGTRRILVVDDQPSMCELLTTILAVTELSVVSAFDGSSALERLRACAYDLLITDLRMPGMDGTALAREAKRLQPDIKVMIVTGYPSQSSAIDAVNIGVDSYLMKPFHPMDVLLAVARSLHLASASQPWLGITDR
jgi:excisionase family DNA binding protein